MSSSNHVRAEFNGHYYAGSGDSDYLQLLDIARRMFSPDAEFQNVTMLYKPDWNGLVEGPTWSAWWIQNSYGTTLSALPFYTEPFTTFLQNSQDLWFAQMGDGHRVVEFDHFKWQAPDGSLCDAAGPNWYVCKQGDGRVDIHDWGMEFAAAGLLMQSELLLISRDIAAIEKYLPMLERVANFIETRRDPKNNLYLVGPAGNLLAPSYAGCRNADGTFGMAYLTGLSVTTIGALTRLIELEKLTGRDDKVAELVKRRELSLSGLKTVTTDEGYFIRSLDPDGTKHGVFGADKHGYFETPPNHDAIALRVADDAQAEEIYAKIASIPQLRPYDFIIPNYPCYDDMYLTPPENEWPWSYGMWVNGGHWSTCEARMILAYYRLGKFEDARRSMHQLMKFAREFRMDAPLSEFGNRITQPKEPINLCYDTLGPAAAFVRGLFEYIYSAESLTLVPHIPTQITHLEQKHAIRFGARRLYLSTIGSGKITSVTINGQAWTQFDATTITLPYDHTDDVAHICIGLGGADPNRLPAVRSTDASVLPRIDRTQLVGDLTALASMERTMRAFAEAMQAKGMSSCYEYQHAMLFLTGVATILDRRQGLSAGRLRKLSEERSQVAADQCYIDTATKVFDGFVRTIEQYAESDDAAKRSVHQLWLTAAGR